MLIVVVVVGVGGGVVTVAVVVVYVIFVVVFVFGQCSAPEGADDLCFHTWGYISSFSSFFSFYVSPSPRAS